MRTYKLAAAALAVALVGCGNGNLGSGVPADGGDGSSGGGDTPGGTPPAPQPRLGSFSGTTFNAGDISISDGTLASGESATLTVSLVDVANSNAPVTGVSSVAFTSNCLSQGDSALSANPANISSGNVTVTYTYTGGSCGASDLITATAVTSTGSVTATGSIAVTAAPATALEFVSATPTNIGLQGSGQPATSQIVFVVKNAAGGPVEGQIVNFALSTTAGGITMTAVQATSGANGRVATIVQSGTVPTSVAVIAQMADNPNTTGYDESLVPTARSSSLIISTGLADQDSFSSSIGCFNIEGGSHDGITTNVNIIASDRFNNPVPDGTPISFRVEGGTIEPSCFTVNGQCTVDFTSSDPRPADHRVSVVAYAVGEESFNDLNGNGLVDSGEHGASQDLDDVYVDMNEDGNYGATDGDILIDFDSDGVYDGPSGSFTGPLCATDCDVDPDGTGPLRVDSLYVRDLGVIIMSGSTATIEFSPSSFFDVDSSGTFDPAIDYIDVSNGAVAVVVAVSDDANQPMPGGTSISGSVTGGVVSLSGKTTFVQPCTTDNGPSFYTFLLVPPSPHADKSGTFVVEVTTPLGLSTLASIGVSDSSSPVPPPPPPGVLNSIQFISASPSTIALAGSGGEETSEVTFQVLTDKGGPVANQAVTFALNNTTGGITISPTTATTDSSGFVSTTVQAGTVHTSVKVTATATQDPGTPADTTDDITRSAESDTLVITTGLADQNSFTFYAPAGSCTNVEGMDWDNEQVTFNVLAGDAFNNPVPDGTAVSFTTEGGRIQGSCTTSAGGCNVTWNSQNPRPDDGRATVLAYLQGEESFTDLNGNGLFEDAEFQAGNDLAEAFLDANDDGTWQAGEFFVDLAGPGGTGGPDGLANTADTFYNGTLCAAGQDKCGGAGQLRQITVRGSLRIFMSGSDAVVDDADVTVTDSATTSYTAATNTFVVPESEIPTFNFVVRDVNDNPMPAGTSVQLASLGNATAGSVVSGGLTTACVTTTSTVANTYKFIYVPADVSATTTNVYELRIKTPNDSIAQAIRFNVTVTP